MKISYRSYNLHFLQYQIVWFIFVLVGLFFAHNMQPEAAKYLFSILATCSLLVCFYTTIRTVGTWLSIYLLFMILAYLFHSGQLLLVFLNIPINTFERYVAVDFSVPITFYANMYALLCLNIMHLAGLLVLKQRTIINQALTRNSKIMLYFAFILFLISFYPKYLILSLQIKMAFQAGYASAFTAGLTYKNSILSNFYFISTIAFMYYFRGNRWLWKIPYITNIGIELISMVLVGNRSMPLASILSLMFFRHRFIKPYSRNDQNKLALYSIFLIFLSSFVAAIRGSAEKHDIISNMISFLTQENFIVKIMTEFGGSLKTLMLTIQHTPVDVGYAYLRTYIYTPLILVPFSTQIFGDGITPYISVGAIMNQFIGGGLGGSFIAEAYYNIGWFGILLMIPTGILIASFENYYMCKDVEKTPFRIIAFGYLLQAVLLYPRGYYYTIFSTLNIIIYSYVIYLVLFVVFKKRKPISLPVQRI